MAIKSGWPKGSASVAAAFPRSLAYITVSVAGLALFLFLASLLLVSSPISSTFQGYFYKVDNVEVIQRNQTDDSYSNVDVDTSGASSNSASESVKYSLPSGSSVEVPVGDKEMKRESEKKDSGLNVEVPVRNIEREVEPEKKDSGLVTEAPVTDKEREVESDKKDSRLVIEAPVTDKEQEVESEKKDSGLEIEAPVTDKEQEVQSKKKDSGLEIEAPVTDKEQKVESEKKDSGMEIEAPVTDKERELESEKKDSGLETQAPVTDKEQKVESEKKDSGLETQAPVTDKEQKVESEKKDSGLDTQAPVTDKEQKVESEKKDQGLNLQVPVNNKGRKEEPGKKDSGLEIQAPVTEERKVESEKKDSGLEIQAPVTEERKVESEKKDSGLEIQAPVTEERKVESEKKDPGLNLQAPVINKGRKLEPGKNLVTSVTNNVDRKNTDTVDKEVDKGANDGGTSSVPLAADPKIKTGEDISAVASPKATTGSDDSGTAFLIQAVICSREIGFLIQSVPRTRTTVVQSLHRCRTVKEMEDPIVEVPKNRGNKRMHRYYFRSTSTMIIRMWSSWLVHQTPEAIDFAPEGVTKVHLDAPDENFMQYVPTFDVVVLSSGHWFAKQSAYVLNNEIIGGQLWWPDKSRVPKINNIEAFGISVETIVASMLTHPNYTGLTILRSYSPDHYEGGAWNTGGSCTGKTKPLAPGQLVKNDYTNVMHQKQVTGYHRGVKRATNKSKIKLMDITEVFSYRHDGHPGPYRSPDPHKRTKYGPDGKPPPQDCLHWCMPGPIDTWNELVLEIIRREFDGEKSSSSSR
ncbi:Protein YLS7 [Linum perenne]